MLRQGKFLSAVLLSALAVLAAAVLVLSWGAWGSGPTAAKAETVPDTGNSRTVTKSQGDGKSPEDLEPAGVSEIEGKLKTALEECFDYPKKVSPDTEVTLAFSLDEQGELVGIPQLTDDPDKTPDVRRLYLGGLLALENCAPFTVGGTRGTFRATIADTGIDSVKDLSKAEPEQKPSVQVAKRVVHSTASQASEDALSLDRSARVEIQRRLKLLDFDPGGVDGVFGKNSRNAITSWQEDKGFPVSGHLNAIQLLALNAQSQAKYDAYQSTNPGAAERKTRVRVCRRIGVLGIKVCKDEYR